MVGLWDTDEGMAGRDGGGDGRETESEIVEGLTTWRMTSTSPKTSRSRAESCGWSGQPLCFVNSLKGLGHI